MINGGADDRGGCLTNGCFENAPRNQGNYVALTASSRITLFEWEGSKFWVISRPYVSSNLLALSPDTSSRKSKTPRPFTPPSVEFYNIDTVPYPPIFGHCKNGLP